MENRTKGYDDYHIIIFSAAYHDLQEIGPERSLSISGQRQAAVQRSGAKAQATTGKDSGNSDDMEVITMARNTKPRDSYSPHRLYLSMEEVTP